jgi:hypothetical protein
MKYFLDIISIVLVTTIALLATQKPAVDLKLRPSSPSIGDKSQLPDAKKEEKERVQKEIVKEVVVLGALKERNIFSPYGSYVMSGAVLKGPLPENPYTLIGVLQGEEKKAVFREYTGTIVTLTVGKKLIDDSIITRIDKLSVVVEKGKEKKELKLFDLENPDRRAPPKPEIAPKPGISPKPGTPSRPELTPRQRK